MLMGFRTVNLAAALIITIASVRVSSAELPPWYAVPFNPNVHAIAELRHLEFFSISEEEFLERCASKIAESRNDPNEQARAYEARGDAYYHFGHFDKALHDYKAAAELDSSNVRVQCSASRAKAALGNESSAVAECLAIVESSPDCFPALELLAMIHAKQRKSVKAIDFATKAIAVSPSVAAPYFWRGTAHAHLGHGSPALQDFDKFIELCPAGLPRNEDVAYYAKASLLAKMGRLDEALAVYQLAWRLKPDSYKTLRNLRVIYQRKGLYSLARSAAEQMAKLDPAQLQTSIALAQSRLETNDAEAAVKPAQDWVKREPNSYHARLVLASVYVHTRDYESANRQYDVAIQLAPRSYDVKIAVALFLSTCPERKYRNPAAATSLLREARALANGNPDESWYIAQIATTAAGGNKQLAVALLNERLQTAAKLSLETRRLYNTIAQHLEKHGSVGDAETILLHSRTARAQEAALR